MKKVGLTIGKYAPLHKGHQLLIETALKEMDQLYVVIYETNLINISLKQRAEWIKKLYPNINVLYAYNPPNQYGLDFESVQIQMEYLVSILNKYNVDTITHFYSSEEYGKYVSDYLKIENRLIDIDRKKCPIGSRIIRNDLENYKEYIEDFIYQEIK